MASCERNSSIPFLWWLSSLATFALIVFYTFHAISHHRLSEFKLTVVDVLRTSDEITTYRKDDNVSSGRLSSPTRLEFTYFLAPLFFQLL
jgi:hypothetical protein